ncbi:heme peroxidase family protein [Solirubrobacter phytolaccae]|uniref:Heme peroxidase family protein n=1 Tax=Solirubrobacter phytolaccae TaxID=1404360 RepID=A0A9X3NGX8_9ACTN|nr:heme peroxidase family protein [Solirubrobacter phytolaccae]MDA0185169.1 heme peroxidase family protein [Solirubrobacter phytolaccae]
MSKHGGDYKSPIATQKTPAETRFNYLLPALKSDPSARLPDGSPKQVNADLIALANAMAEDPPTEAAPAGPPLNSAIPAIYTYWGQFVDHDMTANTDRDGKISNITKPTVVPLDPDRATELPNLRRPTFDLDSLYGNGPGLSDDFYCPDPGEPDTWLYDGAKFRIGENLEIPGADIPPLGDLARDLPRVGRLIESGAVAEADIPAVFSKLPAAAAIADSRNDENLIVAQLHLAFLRFHNRAVDEVKRYPQAFGVAPRPNAAQLFEAARRLTRFHYQWLVVHDYLKTITVPEIVDRVLIDGNRFYQPLPDGGLFAPLEYSVAAFRFGHSMVRGGYDHNRVFGIRPDGTRNFATFEKLFEFTGNGHVIDPGDPSKSTPNPLGGAETLPSNWIIEWDRMTDKLDKNPAHFARQIDTLLVPPIVNMVNQGNSVANQVLREMLRHLARRNLLRGYHLAIPTGQAVAKAMGVKALTEDELKLNNSQALNDALTAGGFLEQTPLWYYILKEAEVHNKGNTLGQLGSLIVVETQLGLLHNDPDSYLAAGWDPTYGVKFADGRGIVSIRDFLEFAVPTS